MRSILFTILLFSITCFSQQRSNIAYEDAAKYSREHRGIAVAVMKDDKIVFEDYAMQGSADLPWMLASGTKSFSGVMCAAAIDDKLISSFDEKVADTITEWKTDPRKSKITIRQLLSLTSGIDAGQIGFVPSYAEAVTKAAKYDPGTRFEYGPVPFQIFGELMTRKLKAKNETVWAYMKRRILDPIDLAPSIWRKNEGQPLLPQ
jgi:CubicO group peptidase (beta-lactamase class C family)